MATGSHTSVLRHWVQTNIPAAAILLPQKKKKKSQRKTESILGYMGDHIRDSYGALNQGTTTSKLDAAIGNRVRSDTFWQ